MSSRASMDPRTSKIPARMRSVASHPRSGPFYNRNEFGDVLQRICTDSRRPLLHPDAADYVKSFSGCNKINPIKTLNEAAMLGDATEASFDLLAFNNIEQAHRPRPVITGTKRTKKTAQYDLFLVGRPLLNEGGRTLAFIAVTTIEFLNSGQVLVIRTTQGDPLATKSVHQQHLGATANARANYPQSSHLVPGKLQEHPLLERLTLSIQGQAHPPYLPRCWFSYGVKLSASEWTIERDIRYEHRDRFEARI
ncbi:hypothetical protein CDV55_101729 [Aspergillus turcosus]|nr:hypothetical protein CDV55_101729 [Aspergillus turcosus]